jgi:ankyrin repeat protein
MLVEYGADVNARGFRGATALHWAVDGRRPEIVRFLLDHGAAVNAQDDDNRTPLQWCISEFKEARFGAVRRLKRIEVLLRERAVFTTGEP